MWKVLCSVVLYILIIPSKTRGIQYLKDCLVYNFEKPQDALTFDVTLLDFLINDLVSSIINEWQYHSFSEELSTPKFKIGSVGIKPFQARPPFIHSYGVSATQIHVVKGGVFQFNLYKQSRVSVPRSDIAYVSVILVDPRTESSENMTLLINRQKEGWSQPLLKYNKSQEMISHIHLFGHSSRTVFFYIDAFRYYAEDSDDADCPMYNSSESTPSVLKNATKIVTTLPIITALQNIETATLLHTKIPYNATLKENIEDAKYKSVKLETTPNVNDEVRTAFEMKKKTNKDFFSSSLDETTRYHIFITLPNHSDAKLETNKTDDELLATNPNVKYSNADEDLLATHPKVEYSNLIHRKTTFYDTFDEINKTNTLEANTTDITNNMYNLTTSPTGVYSESMNENSTLNDTIDQTNKTDLLNAPAAVKSENFNKKNRSISKTYKHRLPNNSSLNDIMSLAGMGNDSQSFLQVEEKIDRKTKEQKLKVYRINININKPEDKDDLESQIRSKYQNQEIVPNNVQENNNFTMFIIVMSSVGALLVIGIIVVIVVLSMN